MMSVLEQPYYVIKPTELAEWLDQEPETWWIVDGDPRLTGQVDFPCPSEELSEALRRYKKGSSGNRAGSFHGLEPTSGSGCERRRPG
jgi:hypothetical protein